MKGRKDLVASAAYLPEPAAVAAARKFVRDALRSWLDTAPGADADGGLVDDAVLLTSELVTNAVVHAGTQVQVTCKLAAGAVEVVVRDSHPARMVPGPAPDDTVPAERTGGRGLLLPSALAAAWGVSYGTDAKAVWFRMGLPGAPVWGAGGRGRPRGAGGRGPGRALERHRQRTRGRLARPRRRRPPRIGGSWACQHRAGQHRAAQHRAALRRLGYLRV